MKKEGQYTLLETLSNFDFYPLKNTTIKNYRFYGPGYTLHLKRQLI